MATPPPPPSASSSKESEKQINKTLATLLRQLYELEAILGDYTQPHSHELLVSRLQEFASGLEQFRQQAAAFRNTPIPVSLLKFVDEGGHPDDFVRLMFTTAVADNQIAAGRVRALQEMRQELAAAAAGAFPAEAAVFESVVAAKQQEALDAPALQQQ